MLFISIFFYEFWSRYLLNEVFAIKFISQVWPINPATPFTFKISINCKKYCAEFFFSIAFWFHIQFMHSFLNFWHKNEKTFRVWVSQFMEVMCRRLKKNHIREFCRRKSVRVHMSCHIQFFHNGVVTSSARNKVPSCLDRMRSTDIKQTTDICNGSTRSGLHRGLGSLKNIENCQNGNALNT